MNRTTIREKPKWWLLFGILPLGMVLVAAAEYLGPVAPPGDAAVGNPWDKRGRRA